MGRPLSNCICMVLEPSWWAHGVWWWFDMAGWHIYTHTHTHSLVHGFTTTAQSPGLEKHGQELFPGQQQAALCLGILRSDMRVYRTCWRQTGGEVLGLKINVANFHSPLSTLIIPSLGIYSYEQCVRVYRSWNTWCYYCYSSVRRFAVRDLLSRVCNPSYLDRHLLRQSPHHWVRPCRP